MRIRIAALWDRLGSSFWFVPLIMTAGAAAMAFVTVAIDLSIKDQWLESGLWVYTGGAEAASAILAAVAGSMITIAGLVFSMTLVALSLTSSQFGPRLLRSFMRDRTNQAVLGTFVATFVYCLLVLGTIRRADEFLFVPHLSVTLGVLLAVTSLAVLIYFIHHVAISIQADEIVARVSTELFHTIDRLYPDEIDSETPTGDGSIAIDNNPDSTDSDVQSVASSRDGYVRLIDADALLGIAERNDLVVRVERRPGEYVVAGTPLFVVLTREGVNDEIAGRLLETFHIGPQRTDVQDIEFGLNQLVEIAVRALSPGLNDPFTAITCVDRLGSVLSRLARREPRSPFRYDDSGKLRVVTRPVGFAGAADTAFNQIRQYSSASTAVTIRLLDVIGMISDRVTRPEDLAVLRRHADMVVRSGRDGLREQGDRDELEGHYDTVCRLIDARFAESAAA